MSESTAKTKSGLQSTNAFLPYDISSSKVELFLRKKFQFVNNELQRNNVKMETVNPEKVNVRGIQIGRSFAPLILTMPETVLIRQSYDPNLPEIFQNEDDDAAKLKPVYWKMLSKWMFTKKDAEDFRSRALQRQLGVNNPNDVREFIYFTKPRLKSMETEYGRRSIVMVIIDPGVLFHDMLVFEEFPNQRFETRIHDFTILEDNEAVYEVYREVIKRKHNKQDKDIEAVGRMMASGR